MSVCIKDLIQNMNLVVGCDIGCAYCYARCNCRRFHITDDFSVPEFFPQKLRLMENRTAHNYLFLTKRPERLDFSCDLESAWFGVTVTSAAEKRRISDLRTHIRTKHYHVTFEPLFDDIGEVDLRGVGWIVIGTETGRRRGKAVSRIEWVRSLTAQAHSLGIPVFMKEDLLPIMGEENMIQELPAEFTRVLEEQ